MNRFGPARAGRIISSGVGIIAALRPAAWFRYATGITSAAGAVSQWDDQSGNGRHLKQSTGVSQPTLQADGSILFDGSNDWLKTDAFTLNQPVTRYVLMKPSAYVAARIYLGGNNVSMDTPDAVNFRIYAGSLAATATAPAAGSYYVFVISWNGASSYWGYNNNAVNTGNAGTNNPGGIALGADLIGVNPAGLTAKEDITFAAAHDAATRALVIAYLSRVGGL